MSNRTAIIHAGTHQPPELALDLRVTNLIRGRKLVAV